jgi:putative peptidoglycan lipid II flippase
LLASVVRARGRGAAAGLVRALGAAAGGGLLGYLAGDAVADLLGPQGLWPNAGAAALAAVVALGVGAMVVAVVDRADAGAVAALLRRGGAGG